MSHDDIERRVAALGRPLRLIVTGGGTGGHTYPALTAVQTMRKRFGAIGAPVEVLWIGTADGLEARVAEREGIQFKSVATGKIRRSNNPLKLASPANVKDMARVPIGAAQACRIVRHVQPDVVLSTGGYVAVPVGLAARLCRRPLVVHEQTTRLGLANRILARVATRVAVSSESTLPLLPDSARHTAVVTGNPVRPEILTGHADKAVAEFGLSGFDRTLPTVYVTGGAQGSVQINDCIYDLLPKLLAQANVIHQCGPASLDAARTHAAALRTDRATRYHVVDFIGDELPDILALADVVISRSGAGTIAELTALGKPAVLIPLSSAAGNEQEHNALHLEDVGAAIALTRDAVRIDRLWKAIETLLNSPEQRRRMAHQAQSLGHPDAADRLVDVVLSALPRP